MNLHDALRAVTAILANALTSPPLGGPGESGWVDALSSVLSSISL